jgi:hypothetical protein
MAGEGVAEHHMLVRIDSHGAEAHLLPMHGSSQKNLHSWKVIGYALKEMQNVGQNNQRLPRRNVHYEMLIRMLSAVDQH